LVLPYSGIRHGRDAERRAARLFDQVYVDKGCLLGHIRQALQTRHQISLADLVKEWPLEHGLAELVAYLSLAADGDAAVIDEIWFAADQI
jgi:hypothetical protein